MRNGSHIIDPPVAEGKKAIHQKMFFDNLGLVNFVVNKIGFASFRSSAALERADLVQFGIMGLLDAIERFNPERGVQFQTYAVSRIKGSIQDELRKLDWVPRSVRKAERHAEAIADPWQHPNVPARKDSVCRTHRRLWNFVLDCHPERPFLLPADQRLEEKGRTIPENKPRGDGGNCRRLSAPQFLQHDDR